MTVVGAVPSLSELMAWPLEHLTDAAAYWQDAGSRFYDAFDQIWRDAVSVDWQGEAAEGLRSRTFADETTVSGVHDQLVMAAKVARIAATELYAARSRMQYAVEDAHTAGFEVGEDLSLTDQFVWSTAAERLARRAEAEALLADIDLRAMQLVGLDRQVAARITGAVAGIATITFQHGGHESAVRPVDFRTPIPQRPKVEPQPPPGGWSSDPLTRAAEKIAYGHADKHLGEFWGGATREELADIVKDMFRRNFEDPGSLVIGRTSDGAPALYDPKTNVLIIRDPKALDAGTVYRPKRFQAYVDDKVPIRVTSLPRCDLEDAFPRAAGTTGPRPMEPPGRPAPVPVEPLPRGFGGGPLPPESIPHPVQPPHSHHGLPVFGKDELPDLDEFTGAP